MKLALVGVGRAGIRIVDTVLGIEAETERNLSDGNVLAFDTAAQSFAAATNIPGDRHVRFGDIHPAIDDEAGVDGRPDLGVEIAREDIHEIHRSFDAIEFEELDGTLLVAGLGGGTGGGAGAVLIEELKSMTEKPVYAVGVLPAEDEPDRRTLNAARALPSFVQLADNVVLVDNESWRRTIAGRPETRSVGGNGTSDGDRSSAGDRSSDGNGTRDGGRASERDDENGDPYEELNRVIASRVLGSFGAGELASMPIAENRVDASDVIRTLEIGGVSSIGQASLDLGGPGGVRGWLAGRRWLPDGLRSWLAGDRSDARPTEAATVKGLVRRAVGDDLTLPCGIDSADRVLLVLSGPPSAVSRKGFEGARYWLEQEADTVEVLAGDEPLKHSSTLTATVVLSNVTDVPRIEALQRRAVAIQNELEDSDRAADVDSTVEAASEPEPTPNPEPIESEPSDANSPEDEEEESDADAPEDEEDPSETEPLDEKAETSDTDASIEEPSEKGGSEETDDRSDEKDADEEADSRTAAREGKEKSASADADFIWDP